MRTLETARLRLRAFTLDDVDDYFRLYSEPAILRYSARVSFADRDLALYA